MHDSWSIRCRDLHKEYQQRKRDTVHAVRGLDLEVLRGECFGLLGPNGAGKTTTVEMLEGLLRPTSGELEILGRSWGKDNDGIRQRIGISLQETRLADKLTAGETVRLFRSFYREGREPEDVIAAVKLESKAGSYVQHLSGGQKQRLAVACALVGDPEILFLDEPTTGLDPQARRDLWDIIREQQKKGCTILLTTHYMDEAERLCDRVAVIDLGKVIALGTPNELIASLAGEHVIEFGLENGRPGGFSAAQQQLLDGGISQLEGVTAWRQEGEGYALTVKQPHVALPALLHMLEKHHHTLAHLTTRHASLEDVFVGLTGRHLSEDTDE